MKPGEKGLVGIFRCCWLIGLCFTVSVAQGAERAFIKAVTQHDLVQIQELGPLIDDIDLATNTGKTALMVAAKAGDENLVRWLLSLGANPHRKNQNGGTTLMFASISGNVNVIDALLDEEVNIDAKGTNGWGALMIAAAKGHVMAVDRLLRAGVQADTHDVYYWTPLHRAAYENREQVIRRLLKAPDIKINARDDRGATALHHAAKNGNQGIARALIMAGANPDLPDVTGLLPREYASQAGQEEIVPLLTVH